MPPLDTLVTEARPPPKTLTMPLSVVVMILPPESTLSVPPESTITPVLVCPELTLRVPPLETVGIAKAPGRQSSREQLRRGPHPPTPFFSGADHTTDRTRGPQNSGGQSTAIVSDQSSD